MLLQVKLIFHRNAKISIYRNYKLSELINSFSFQSQRRLAQRLDTLKKTKMSRIFRNSAYQRIYNIWIKKEKYKDLHCPFLQFLTAGNVWDSFISIEEYFGAKNHFLFEEPRGVDKEFLIDKDGNFFIIKYDKKEKVIYPEFIEVITRDKMLDLVNESEILELIEYESMKSFDEIFKNLMEGNYSYY